MGNRPYVLLSVAMSVDGYIDDTTPQRLMLSNDADFDRVDAERAECDAIMIGAETIRRDNPRLLVKSDERRAAREARGLPPYPLKVTLTRSGDLDPDLKFWHYGGAKLAYAPAHVADKLRARLGDLAEVASTGETLDVAAILNDLGARGIRKLMVEGGGTLHTQFLAAGLADEIQLAIAPFFLGTPEAPRFVNPAFFPDGPGRRMTLASVQAVGDMAVLRYLPASAAAEAPGRSAA
jgi:5-amino-6-(5-phosphoribosylamino)uracil reductase